MIDLAMTKLKYLVVACLLVGFFGCKQETYQVGQIITDKGEILFWLYDETPLHKASFIDLASSGYWDSLHFNRVIDNFVVQGGCPDTPAGFSDSPYLISPEFNDSIKHTYGAVGAGRDENPDKISAGCQLYIVDAEEGLPRLDGEYMIFGQMFKGFDVLENISKVATDKSNTPLDKITIDVNVVDLTENELIDLGYNFN